MWAWLGDVWRWVSSDPLRTGLVLSALGAIGTLIWAFLRGRRARIDALHAVHDELRMNREALRDAHHLLQRQAESDDGIVGAFRAPAFATARYDAYAVRHFRHVESEMARAYDAMRQCARAYDEVNDALKRRPGDEDFRRELAASLASYVLDVRGVLREEQRLRLQARGLVPPTSATSP